MKTIIKGTVLWINHNPLKVNQKMLLVEPIQYRRNGNVLHAKNGVYYVRTNTLGFFHKGSNGIMITNLMDAEFISSEVFA